MTDNILFPESIYRYKRHIKPDGSMGTRFDLVGHEGQEYPALVRELKRDGARVIYYGLDTRRHKVGVWRGKEGQDSGWLSEVFQPDIKMPGLGFADLGDRADAALLLCEGAQAGNLSIYAFPGLGKQSQVLFEMYQTGAVRLSLSNNNVKLSTLSVQVAAYG